MDKNTTLPASTLRFTRDLMRFAGRRGAVAALLVLLSAALEGVGLVMLVPILSVVLGSGGSGFFARTVTAFLAATGAVTRFERLAVLLGIFALLVLLRGVTMLLRDIRLNMLQTGFVNQRRADIVRQLTQTRWDVVARLRHARLSHLMSGDMQNISSAASILVQNTVALATLVIQCGLAFLLSPPLALVVLALMALSAALLGRVMAKARLYGQFSSGRQLSLLNMTAQFLGGVKLAVSQNLTGNFLLEFRTTLDELHKGTATHMRSRGMAQLVATVGISLVSALVMLVGFGILNVAPAVLFTVLFLLSRVIGPVTQLNMGMAQLATSLPAYDKVCELEDELRDAAMPPVAAAATVPDGPVVFRDVSFSWPERARPVLDRANLVLEPGRFIGIGGASGTGKTSFADLLVGLFAPSGGQISVGGMPLEGAMLPAWRQQLSYVSQDPFLFHDTIRRNLTWAAPGADADMIAAALALTAGDQVVARMPEGLETMVGERGQLMSGGERQRLALSRALLRRPRLLVLDEATNAIDIAGERVILEQLKALPWRPTVVMIAHRSESFEACDEVWTLQDGNFQRA